MNREEAIKILEYTLYCVDEETPKGANEAEAIPMAVEALNREQEKYDAICSELIALKSDLTKPIEVAIAYENSIAIVRKYAERF